MNWWIVGGLAVAVVLMIVANRLGWVDFSNKNRSSGSASISGIGDEVFHPTRHEAQLELDRQTMLPAPAPVPGDGDKGIFDGKIVIDLSKKS